MRTRVAKDSLDKALKVLLSILVLCLLNVVPGYAQISYKAQEKHSQKMRQALKEADKADVPYKDTHLNIDAYRLKKGVAGRKRLNRREEYATYYSNERGETLTLGEKIKNLFRKKENKRSEEETKLKEEKG